jgi:hypothetical protein
MNATNNAVPYQNPLLKLLTARLYIILEPNLNPETPPGTYDTKKVAKAAIWTTAEIKVRRVECNCDQKLK